MVLGLLDLSIVTDSVLAKLRLARDATRLWAEDGALPIAINFSGLAPDAARALAGCQISLYLFHVEPDKTYRNAYPTGGRARVIPQQPMALVLYYVLSAHSESYVESQQAMSIALKGLHDLPIQRASVAHGGRDVEFTFTMHPQSVDEIGRLWLAFSTPMRLSAVYRASVIFLEPEEEKPAAGIVLHPHLGRRTEPEQIHTLTGGPPAIVDDIPAFTNGLVTVNGNGFDPATIIVWIGGLVFAQTTATPLTTGQMIVSSATSLTFQLPSLTPRGRYLLRIRLAPDGPATEVWFNNPVDVP